MASSALLKVLFPDGTIRYGHYGATSDIPSEALTDTSEEYDCLPFRWDTPNPEGEPVAVEIACDYGGGFWWTGTAFPDRLVDSGMIDPGNGWDPPHLKPTTKGYPYWWIQDDEISTTLPCCFGEYGKHRPSCRFAPSP